MGIFAQEVRGGAIEIYKKNTPKYDINVRCVGLLIKFKVPTLKVRGGLYTKRRRTIIQ